MNSYFEFMIAALVTVCTGLLLVSSLFSESPMKGMFSTFALLVFAASLTGLRLVWKELKKARTGEDAES